jgi:enoyl-CoA hydratase
VARQEVLGDTGESTGLASSAVSNDTPMTYSLDDDVAVVHLDDGKANALDHVLIGAIDEAITRAEREAGALVIIGREGRFSAGFDLSIMTAGMDSALPLLEAGANLAVRLYLSRIPVVLGCTGHALAMGAILLMVADERIGASGPFKLGMNEVAIGMPVPRFAVEIARDRLAKTHFVPAIQLARIYDPEGAVDAGYLDRTVSPDQVADEAIARARELATTLNRGAFKLTRDIARAAVADQLRASLAEDMGTFTVES